MSLCASVFLSSGLAGGLNGMSLVFVPNVGECEWWCIVNIVHIFFLK